MNGLPVVHVANVNAGNDETTPVMRERRGMDGWWVSDKRGFEVREGEREEDIYELSAGDLLFANNCSQNCALAAL